MKFSYFIFSIKMTTPRVRESRKVKLEDWCHRIITSKDNEYYILKHFTTSGNGEFFIAITSEHYLVGLKIFVDKKHSDKEIENLKIVQNRIHDVFLPYLDYFIVNHTDGKYYIMVVKYFEGWIRLSDYLRKCLFYEEQKLSIISKIESSIQKLHQLSIVHQDIYEEKVLIHANSGHIRIIDLGFCLKPFEDNLSIEEFKALKEKDFVMLKSF